MTASQTPDPQAPEAASASASEAVARGAPSKNSWWVRWHISLVLLVGGFATAYYFVSLLRFEEFYGTNWDLGINMQMLWSTTHGYLLYESGDYETSGFKSILSVHSTFIALPFAYLYGIFPAAQTLFALQALAVSSSAIPLYLIGRKAGLPDSWLVAALAVYLISFGISSALLYDFHWESFIPAEFAWTYYLWSTRRYALAYIPAVLGVLTLEVFPFLLLGLVLCFAYPIVRSLLSKPSEVLQKGSNGRREIRPLFGMFLFAVAVYVVYRIVEDDVIPRLVGTVGLGSGAQVSLGFNQIFRIGATSTTIPPSLVYWFLLLAAFGFLPLLVSQSRMLLSVPWFWASVFIQPLFSTEFGDQYAFIAIATVVVAFIEGLAVMYRAARETDATALLPLEWLVAVVPLFVISLFFSTDLLGHSRLGETLLLISAAVVLLVLLLVVVPRRRSRGWTKTVLRSRHVIYGSSERPSYRQVVRLVIRHPPGSRKRTATALGRIRVRPAPVIAGVLILLVCANVALSPFNPSNFQATIFPGYSFSFSGNSAYPYMDEVLSHLPAGAQVLASDNLFPFVANDLNAYSLQPFTTGGLPFLPFNSSHLPTFVLLSTSEWGAVPGYLQSDLFNRSIYGIESMIYCSGYPCAIYLFESGYHGSTDVLQATPFPNEILVCPQSLSLGASGRLVAADGTRCGSEIESVPASNLSGNGHTVWFGPYMTLLPGLYNLTMSLKGGLYPGQPANAQIVLVDGNGYGVSPYWYFFNLNATQLHSSQWTNVTVALNLTYPVAGVEFRGYLNYGTSSATTTAYGFVDLNYLQVDRTVAGA